MTILARVGHALHGNAQARRSTNPRLWVILSIFAVLVFPPTAHGYSVLTHEAIIDTLWIDAILPVLKQRFPEATEEQLKQAHAFAYGGCIIQDLGYYPFGSHLFSDF